jgi:hypothetical protein
MSDADKLSEIVGKTVQALTKEHPWVTITFTDNTDILFSARGRDEPFVSINCDHEYMIGHEINSVTCNECGDVELELSSGKTVSVQSCATECSYLFFCIQNSHAEDEKLLNQDENTSSSWFESAMADFWNRSK